MRLYKKAAVCLLAAAMAVSMMTACGGGAGGSGAGPAQGTTYTNSESLVAGIDEGSMTNVQPLEVRNSRYAAAFSAQSAYMEEISAMCTNGVLGTTSSSIYASNYTTNKKQSYTKSGNYEVLSEVDGNDVYTYKMVESDGKKAAVKEKETVTPGTSGGEGQQPSTSVITMQSANVTIGGIPYYAEIMKTSGSSMTYCYKGDSPVPTYEFYEGGNYKSATVYKKICVGSDNGVFAAALAGREIYTVTSMDSKSGKATFTDSNGAEYTATAGWNGSSMTWTVKKGETDVTDEFSGLLKDYMKRYYGIQ